MSGTSAMVCPHCLHELSEDGPCRCCGIVFRQSDWKNCPEAHLTDGLRRQEDGTWALAPLPSDLPAYGGILNPASELVLDPNRVERVLIGSGRNTRIRIEGAESEAAVIFHVGRAGSTNSGWWLFGSGVASGFRLNGSRVRLHRLENGDIVEIAGVYLQYFAGDADVPSEFVPVKPNPDRLDIVVRDLSVTVLDKETWRHRVLLDGISFCVRKGEMVAVVGPSGCGKTTLLRRLAGLAEHDGEILFGGRSRSDAPDAVRKAVAYLPQSVDRSLSDELTLDDEIRCQLQMFRKDCVAPSEVAGILRSLNLSRKRKCQIREFSGGEKRRAAAALARLRNPGVLLLDEPTAGLDPASEENMIGMMKAFAKQGGIVLCSTHILQCIGAFDKVLVLARGGRMRAFGPPGEVLPDNRADMADFYHGLESAESDVADVEESGNSLAGRAAAFIKTFFDGLSSAPRRILKSIRNLKTNIPSRNEIVRCFFAELNLEFRTLVAFRRTKHPVVSFFGSPLFLSLVFGPVLAGSAVWYACHSGFGNSTKVQGVCFCCVMSLLLLGMFNNVRHLVATRIPGRCLERLAGVPLLATLCASAVSLFLVSAVQTCVFLATLFGLSTPTECFHPTGWLFPVLFAVSFAGGLFGLVLSAVSENEMSAMRLAPLAAIFVLFFSQPGIGFDFLASDETDSSEVSFSKRFMPTYRPQFLMWDLMSETADKDARKEPFVEFTKLYAVYFCLFPVLAFGFEKWRERQWDGC